MTELLDGNVLVALLVREHVHRDLVLRWWSGRGQSAFATCPLTQGTLLRVLIRGGVPSREAWGTLSAVASQPHHQFWPDSIGYADVEPRGVVDHRQLTDAYLAQLARVHAGRLVTLDRGLAAAHPDVATLISTPQP